MKNLLNFLIRCSTWFIFSFYVLISILLLFLNSSYHHSVFLSSANGIAGSIYKAKSEVTGYFNLKSINEDLQKNNALLEKEILNLRYEIAEYKTLLSDTLSNNTIENRYSFIPATVIKNSVREPNNYFSINRGFKDGIKPGMGVVDQNGIIGIVNVAGPHTARVISLLNESQRFSVKIKGTEFVGSLCWKGDDPTIAYMEEVPRHAKYNIGDTIVTSGYSLTFPEDMMAGTIMNRIRGYDDNFFILKVKLNSNFKTLSSVRVINDNLRNELDSLQKFDIENLN